MIAEAVASSIDIWYERRTRSWVVQLKDAEGNQIGESSYVHSRREADKIAARLKVEHEI